jgi:predicted RNase H-like nuclease (RuvC/YqgF family)
MRGVKYIRNSTNRSEYGVIAQEIEEVAPELVFTDPNTGLKAVHYQNLVSPLIEAVKSVDLQCHDRMNALEEENQHLKDEVDQLRKEMDELKALTKSLLSKGN